jgi:aminotransferase
MQHFYANQYDERWEWHSVARLEPVKRLKLIKPSGIRRFVVLAQELPAYVNFEHRRAQFLRSRACVGRGWQAVRQGRTHCAPTNGVAELREAFAQKAHRDYGLNYDPSCEILITVGGIQAVFITP